MIGEFDDVCCMSHEGIKISNLIGAPVEMAALQRIKRERLKLEMEINFCKLHPHSDEAKGVYKRWRKEAEKAVENAGDYSRFLTEKEKADFFSHSTVCKGGTCVTRYLTP